MSADLRRILFVITSSTNMGDLALCQEWIEDLGREAYVFAFVSDPAMHEFIDTNDICYALSRDLPVRETLLTSCDLFNPDAVIFATNAFWNLPGYQGVRFGEFVLSKDDLDVPVLSYDPFEIGFKHSLPQNGLEVNFSSVPDWVYALRYLSREPKTPNARHFRTKKVYGNRVLKNEDIIQKYGGQANRKTVVFPISKDRYLFIKEHYPEYYDHLASLFRQLSADQVQFFTVLPEKVTAFESCDHVVQLPFIPFQDFLDLVQSSDLYLTDSFVSCIVTAFQLETPAMLLTNSQTQVTAPCFLGEAPFPYRVFPYGMADVCEELEALYEIENCYAKYEVLDTGSFRSQVLSLIEPGPERTRLEQECRQWKEARKGLSSPSDILDEVLNKSSKALRYGS